MKAEKITNLLLCVLLVFSSAGLFAQTVVFSDSVFAAIKSVVNDSERFENMLQYERSLADNDLRNEARICEELIEQATNAGNRSVLMRAHQVLGWNYNYLGNHLYALKNLLISLKIARETKDLAGEAKALYTIALFYEERVELEKAKKYALAALKVAEAGQLYRYQYKSLNTLGIVYTREKKLALSVETFKRAIAINRAHNPDFLLEATFYSNLGNSLKDLKRYEEALQAYQHARHLSDSLESTEVSLNVMDNMAWLYYRMNKPDIAEKQALLTLQAVSRELSEVGRIPYQLDMYDLLWQLNRDKKNTAAALDYFMKRAAIKDSLANEEREKQVAELQTRFDTELKDQTIEAQHTEIAYAQKLNSYLSLGAALLLILGATILVSQRKTHKLNTQITIQKNELSMQKDELEQVNKVKDRLFSVISHDLRGPVNNLHAFTRLLEEEGIPGERLVAYSSELKNTLGHASGLMENLLNWARSQMQGYHPVMEAFDLSVVAGEAVEVLATELKRKNIVVNNTIKKGVEVYADRNMTALLFRNLLSNSIKYSQAGSPVEITSFCENGIQNFSISDSGTGLDAQRVDAFNDSRNTVPGESTHGTANEKGTGLGLLLCKTFAVLMGGSILLQSEPGKGSTFTVSLKAV